MQAQQQALAQKQAGAEKPKQVKLTCLAQYVDNKVLVEIPSSATAEEVRSTVFSAVGVGTAGPGLKLEVFAPSFGEWVSFNSAPLFCRS